MMTTWLALTSCVLLALVAGLLVVVGVWLRELRGNARRLPALGEDVTRALLAAKNGLDQLKTLAGESVPDLQKRLESAENVRQDLKFLIARAEQVADRLEKAVEASAKGKPDDVYDEGAGGDRARLRAVIAEAATIMGPSSSSAPAKHEPLAVVPLVAQANMVAAQTSREPSRPDPRDPLDELLAGLAKANEDVASLESAVEHVRRGGGPVSQAELDLRKKMGKAA